MRITVKDTTLPVPLSGSGSHLRCWQLGQNSFGGSARTPHSAQRIPVSRPARASSKKCFSVTTRSFTAEQADTTVAVLPPSVWTSPVRAPSTWRAPAPPRSWVTISPIWAAPVAPIGCPLALRPPEGFTGIFPPRLVHPFSAAMPPVPGSKNPSPSVATISAMVKQSCSSTTSTSAGVLPARR